MSDYKDYMYTPDCPFCRFFGNIDGACEDCQHRKTYPDLVAVIRCRDCKYGDTGTDEDGNKFWKCLGIHYGGTKPNDFCSYGERKSDE